MYWRLWEVLIDGGAGSTWCRRSRALSVRHGEFVAWTSAVMGTPFSRSDASSQVYSAAATLRGSLSGTGPRLPDARGASSVNRARMSWVEGAAGSGGRPGVVAGSSRAGVPGGAFSRTRRPVAITGSLLRLCVVPANISVAALGGVERSAGLAVG